MGRFLTILFCLFLSSTISSAQLWKSKVMTEADEIQQNRRLEIGVQPDDRTMELIRTFLEGNPHQRKGLNPFVSWDINIEATFTYRETGEKFPGIGFWYTDIQRDPQNGHWKQLATEMPFRIRFAPPKPGEWMVSINAHKPGEKVEIGTLFFTVVSSEFSGHVQIDASNKYLTRDDQVIIPTGINLPFPYVNNNLMYSQQRDEKLKLRAWVEYRKMVEQYLFEGGKHFRFFIHPSSTDIEFQELGYYQDRQHFAWEVDKIIELCEENGALINFNLMYHTMMMRMGDYHQFKFDFTDNWHDESAWPYKDINHISGYAKLLNSKRPSDMFLEEKAFKYLRQKTRYIMARWGYSTAISIVELISEPWHVDENGFKGHKPYDSLSPAGDRARKAIYKYHKDLSAYIKDSLKFENKLLGAVGRLPVGSENVYSHVTTQLPDQVDSTWHDQNIDLISISYYSKSPAKGLISKSSSNNECGEGENSMACVIQRLHSFYDKPVLFGESDHGDGTHICSELQGHYVDVKRYPFTGSAGHYLWATFNYPDHTNEHSQDERKSWDEIISAMEYYNSPFMRSMFENQFIQGREKSPFRGSREALIEHQYLIDSSRSTAVGYIYNRSYNVHTASGKELSKESPCFLPNSTYQDTVTVTWKPQKIKVQGLKLLRKYTIHYYGYNKGEFLQTREVRSSLFGRLTLKHPALTPHKNGNPIIWYRIERKR